MLDSGYTMFQADHCFYVKKYEDCYIILLLYVDNMLIVGLDMEKIKELKEQLLKEFELKDFVLAKKILGIKINRDRSVGILKLSQVEYIEKVL